MPSISICIPAYNEESNIANLLDSLTHQVTFQIKINQIVVISSGSTDQTNNIVRNFSKKDSRIKLIRQDKRAGKVSAINEFLKVADGDFLVLESADTIPDKQTIERLCLPLTHKKIGMTGAHPIPVNDQNNFLGYASHLEWALHDRISIRRPKCGELVAFKKLFDTLPIDVAVDEAWIEYEIAKRNYEIVYVPEAIVYNKGPETINDFLKQRRRIACGHIDLEQRAKFDVASSQLSPLLLSMIDVFPVKEPKKMFFFISAVVLEGVSKFLGYYDYYTKKEKHAIWDISKTTKVLV
ncbi:MAG: glycosyltransferase [Nitrososphaerota archaeon]|nr:glycosyltransferase [Nitrososphaerota archaeon]